MKIVTFTISPTIDVNTEVKHVLPERKLRCKSPHREPGGGGINVSRAIKKLGGESLAIYPAGGATGKLLHHLMDIEQITQKVVPVDVAVRENFIIKETVSHQQFRFGLPSSKMDKQEWEHCLAALRHISPTPEYIVASGSVPPGVPMDFYARLASLGKKLGARVIVDTAGEPLCEALEEGVFMVKPNIAELQDIAGQTIESEEQIKAMAMKFIENRGSQVVVISIGAGGALLVTSDLSEHFRSPTVPIRSKVGAGDSMTAGIVLHLSRGNSIAEATQFGVAAGAAAVMTPGTELCRKEDTERLYKLVA